MKTAKNVYIFIKYNILFLPRFRVSVGWKVAARKWNERHFPSVKHGKLQISLYEQWRFIKTNLLCQTSFFISPLFAMLSLRSFISFFPSVFSVCKLFFVILFYVFSCYRIILFEVVRKALSVSFRLRFLRCLPLTLLKHLQDVMFFLPMLHHLCRIKDSQRMLKEFKVSSFVLNCSTNVSFFPFWS